MVNLSSQIKSLVLGFVNIPRPFKRCFTIFLDGFVIFLVGILGGYFFSTFAKIDLGMSALTLVLVSRVPVLVMLFANFGLYRLILRISEGRAAQVIWKSLSWYIIFYVCLAAGFREPTLLAWMVFDVALVSFFTLGWRLSVIRIIGSTLRKRSLVGRRSVIYGAGDAGKQLAYALLTSADHCLCGFIDDSTDLHGQEILGVPVIPFQSAGQFILINDIVELMLAIPSLSEEKRKKMFDKLEALPVRIRTLPGLLDLANGVPTISDLSELRIEDLLYREPTLPDESLLSSRVRERVVMVTGAGGSIGSELCRQILSCNPSILILFELSESALYQIDDSLNILLKASGDRGSSGTVKPKIVPIIGSVTDKILLDHVLAIWKPYIIYHAAAMKHVPIVEQNIASAVKNNVLGMLNLTTLAIGHNIENLVLISSDKAVNPTNVMGATKRVCEHILQSLAYGHQPAVGYGHGDKSISKVISGNRFCIVRFGNVLGSSGSVVPKFQKQIDELQPITLTHKDIERYFMTIKEAAQLVLQASAMSTENAERAEVFILDMGDPVKIYDLAKRMVKLSGLTLKDDADPQGDIEIKITGLRPGEKLFEELTLESSLMETEHPRIFKVEEGFNEWSDLEPKLNELKVAVDENNIQGIVGILQKVVEGYNPPSQITDHIYLENQKIKSNVP